MNLASSYIEKLLMSHQASKRKKHMDENRLVYPRNDEFTREHFFFRSHAQMFKEQRICREGKHIAAIEETIHEGN